MKRNNLNKIVSRVTSANIPSNIKSMILSLMFNSKIKLAFTNGIRINELTESYSILSLRNRYHIQNHIGGIHACSMALLAESATGVLVGLHVPDTHVPLIKSMKINYLKRATGDLTAHARLTSDQINDIQAKDKGDILVDVKLKDATGIYPISCEMVWAWTAKRKKKLE